MVSASIQRATPIHQIPAQNDDFKPVKPAEPPAYDSKTDFKSNGSNHIRISASSFKPITPQEPFLSNHSKSNLQPPQPRVSETESKKSVPALKFPNSGSNTQIEPQTPQPRHELSEMKLVPAENSEPKEVRNSTGRLAIPIKDQNRGSLASPSRARQGVCGLRQLGHLRRQVQHLLASRLRDLPGAVLHGIRHDRQQQNPNHRRTVR